MAARPLLAPCLLLVLSLASLLIQTSWARPVEGTRSDAREATFNQTMAGAAYWTGRLAEAYPDRIQERALRGGDWALLLDGIWFHWAGGRLLPESRRFDLPLPDPHAFFAYETVPPDRSLLPEEDIARIEARLRDREARRIERDSSFFDQLWGGKSADFYEDHIRKIRFLGRTVSIHKALVPRLERIERVIRTTAGKDANLSAWVRSIGSIEGWNQRSIKGTRSLSLHSYGIALDLVPARFGTSLGYWRWAWDPDRPWYRAAWERRWKVPEAVVGAFHAEGFIWGGNWVLFDPIHFEYRPELLPPENAPVSPPNP